MIEVYITVSSTVLTALLGYVIVELTRNRMRIYKLAYRVKRLNDEMKELKEELRELRRVIEELKSSLNPHG